jgi:hypothetical protein
MVRRVPLVIFTTRMEDPAHPQPSAGLLIKSARATWFPQGDRHGRRYRDAALGKIGKQKIEDAGTLYPNG